MEESPNARPVGPEPMDPALFKNYLNRVCPLLLDADDDFFSQSLNISIYSKLIEEFVKDNRNHVLIIKKTEKDEGISLIQ